MVVDGDVEGLDNPSSPNFRLNGNWFVDGFTNILFGSAGCKSLNYLSRFSLNYLADISLNYLSVLATESGGISASARSNL